MRQRPGAARLHVQAHRFRQARGRYALQPLETANAGYGLAGMRERLLLIGGSLLAGPDGGDKWVVTAQVPQ
ncbi:MAG: hypothetical protein M0005_09020 [Actinomycetota bacterium]|nr:hypothetical protein [Actinomycetota bacterium]